MRSLVIAVASNCEFAQAFVKLGYDLGHIIYVAGNPDKSLQELMNNLQIPRLETDFKNSVDLYISDIGDDSHWHEKTLKAVMSTSELAPHQYEISWLNATNSAAIEIQQLMLEHLCNGADIYQEILNASLQTLNSVIAQVAQNAIAESSSPAIVGVQVNLGELRAWHRSNETFAEFSRSFDSLFSAFEASANTHPEQIALVFEGRTLTYGELYRLSLRCAASLQSHLPASESSTENSGKNSGIVIALALHKSVELYAAILGVLALGATYVPIDPEYPEERITNIIKSAQPLVLVKHADANVTAEQVAVTLDVDQLGLNLKADVPALKTRNYAGENAAVIIYTSGSTGMPKGVQLSHYNILHFCYWYEQHVELSPASRALQFTTVSFDASLLDIFPTLITGATLIVPNKEQRHDFAQLNELVIAQQATHSFIPPAMLGALPDYDWPSMRHIVTGGDVCDLATIERWSKNRGLHNIYGPTECTVMATTEQFFANTNNKVIGKPMSNVRIYLLNEAMQPVTTQEHGELFIAGKGVGLGYYNAPDMTQERFVPNPFGEAGELMYKTGDTCYWDHQGKIHFVGRKDNQLKIRGFRVELGEIENVILDTGLYQKCTVVANDKKQIRAFVSQAKEGASVAVLEERIKKILPHYMVPYHIMALEQFPSTVNGKIDRNQLLALPIVELSSLEEETFNETEASLRQIWVHTLGLAESDISKHESFFNLGGHSLLVSKMLLAVKNQFKGGFTLARFMENPTLAALASLLTDEDLQKGDQISERIYSDMVLDSSIKPCADTNPHAFAPKAVLLTGANGFLGVHILEEIIAQTNAVVYCLIRASSEEYAYKKLHDAYEKYGVKTLDAHPRVKTIIGDLEQPLLGLGEHQFAQLAEKIDAIYHNGALVNHIYDYDYLYESNVRSTLDLLRLATTSKNKQFVYISTLSAASNMDAAGRLVEDGPADHLPAFVNNGYNLTKWVSEQLVWQAHNRGLPVTLVRPGNICGHSQTGHCYPDQNRILLLLKGSAQLGFAPDWKATFDLCPVDFIAKGIVAGTTEESGHTPVLHFHNPMPLQWSEYVSRLNHHQVPLQMIAPEVWREMLLGLDESNALFNVISFYLDEKNEDIGDISIIDFQRTLNRLQQFGMAYPHKDHALVDANLGYLVRSGFIKATQGSVSTSAQDAASPL